MTNETSPSATHRVRRIQTAAGAYALGTGLLSFAGWAFGVYRLTDWFGSGITIKANAAVAAIVAGAGSLALALRPEDRWVVRASGGFVALLGGLTLVQHLTGLDFRIDTLLFHEASNAPATASPGRMGLPASGSFLLIGLALALRSAPRPPALRAAVLGFGVAVTTVSALSLLGYLYGAQSLYTIPGLTGIAFQTATMTLLLGLGLVASVPERGPVSLLLDEGPAGLLFRRVLPWMLILPVMIGWLRVQGQRAGLYDSNFGVALRTVLEVAVLTLLMWWSARALQRHERQRAEVEARARSADLQSRTLLANLPGGAAFVVDRDLRYVMAEGEALRESGMTRDGLVGKTISEALDPALATLYEPRYRQALAGEAFVHEHDSHGRTFLTRGAPLRDEAGEVRAALAFSHDITDRKQQEAALLASEERFRATFDNAAVGIALLTPEGRWARVNDAICRITGYPREELLTKTFAQITHPDDVDADWSQASRLLAGEIPFYAMEKRYVQKGGAVVWINLTVSLTCDQGGAPLNFVSVVEDITERKRIEASLREVEQMLRLADRRKDEFLATLAHELRNPLAPIMNAVHLLNHRRDVDPVIAGARTTIQRQTSHLVRLVDDLLDVSRISRGKITLARRIVTLASVVEHAVETARPLCLANEQELVVDLPPEPIALDVDPTRIAQAIGNLLSNACRYTHRGGRVALRVRREDGGLSVGVEDNGIGIPPDKLDAIFEMFGQLDRSQERASGGLGIGLHLVKRLVELHGGTVTARSEGAGSQFTLWLPPTVIASGEAVSLPPVPAAPSGGPRQVLIVDDNADSADSLALLLTLEGHHARVAYDGVEAVESAVANPPDLVLLDLGMPRLDGYDACRQIRQGVVGRRPLMVAMTGWGQDQDRRKSSEAGFDHHLVKPVDYDELLALLAAEDRWAPHEDLS